MRKSVQGNCQTRYQKICSNFFIQLFNIRVMTTGKTMLDYCKKVLKAVSFDKNLFRKEYRKSLIWLTSDESLELKYWIRSKSLIPNLKPIKQSR